MSAGAPPCTRFIPGSGCKGNRCTTCQRKQRHHPAPSGNPHVTNPWPTQRHAASCPLPSENHVQEILNQYTRSHSQPRITNPQFELIRHEAVSGLRKMPPCAAKLKPSTRGFMPVNMAHTGTSRAECIVKIGMLFMTPHGLGQDGELSDNKMPQKAELEKFHQYGMLISEDGGQPTGFLISWTAKDIDSWLRRLLPKPFEWLDVHLGKLDEGSFHWVLLSSERKRYFVLRHTTITGKELDEAKGSVERKFTTFSVVVAPCTMIPKSVYSNWDHAISKALHGSADTEDDSEASDLDPDEDLFDNSPAAHNLNPAHPINKGKAPARSVAVSELSITDSESGLNSDSDVQIIEPATAEWSNHTPHAFLIATTNDEVAPSQSIIP
ncbi:hypothetical protein J3R83DRAFT_7952 [Lanmaoa asiatica]|nr:hypothetical protein J3R83DRAFT_7952 [Lanmaoa asiatica]